VVCSSTTTKIIVPVLYSEVIATLAIAEYRQQDHHLLNSSET